MTQAYLMCAVCAAALANSAIAQVPESNDGRPCVVQIRKTDAGYRMLRNGEPYYIKGVGGRDRLEDLVAAGGNSIRTWHISNLRPTLDRAHRLGLTVTVGIWLSHERHGFDYSNETEVAKEIEKVRRAVLAYKDHPAVLMWGIGNEMEEEGNNPKVWKTVNAIAKMIKEIDPNHPTMTVIAGVWNNKIRKLNQYCPDIDVVGVNIYGDLSSLPEAMKTQSLNRPYVVTEFGPFGWWQSEKTSWGAEIEPTSTQKAETYLSGYRVAVTQESSWCLGAYAFLWGHKQEHTSTWFGMFLPSGERTGAVDAMTFVWTGRWPANRSPEISSLKIGKVTKKTPANASGEHVFPPGSRVECHVKAEDPDADALTMLWELRAESTDKKTGGDKEKIPPAYPEAIISTTDNTLVLQTPKTKGAYRIFIYVLDGKGNAATANVPILVK